MLKKSMLIGLLWATGCASTGAEPVDEDAAEKLAQFERTGEVTSCLNVRQISNITAVDERTLLIQSGVNDYYVSDLESDCNGATRSSTRFEYSTSTAQLCRNEIIRIVDSGGKFLVGSCGMGSFERLKKREVPAQ
jgi:hypothetical protein